MISIRALVRLSLLACFVFSVEGCGGGGGGGGSSDDTLRVSQQPVSLSVTAGETARFSSTASVAGASVQWSRMGQDIPGATATELVLADVSMADNGAMFVATFTSGGRSVSSQMAGLMVTPRFAVDPPDDVRVDQGESATFVARLQGSNPVFQWQRSIDGGASWVAVAGATQSTYTTPIVGLSDHAAQFRVVVGTGGAQVISEPSYLQVRPRLSLVAGRAGGCGHADGLGALVRLCNLDGITTVGADIFVIEGGPTPSRVRKIAPDGTVSTFATLSDSGGEMVADAAGNLYVALTGQIKKIRPDGTAVEFVGSNSSQQGLVDGTGADARFVLPWGLAIDAAGNLYVSDVGNHTIRKVTPGGVVTTLAGAPGSATDGLLNYPTSLAVAANGDIIVADTENNVVRRITQAGSATLVAGTVGVYGYLDATGSSAQFARPRHVAIDSSGVIYVSDNNYAIRRIATNGAVTTLAGNGTQGIVDGHGGAARINGPAILTFDNAGNLLAAGMYDSSVRRVTPAGDVTTIAGSSIDYDAIDGSGATARLGAAPGPVAIAPDGMAYFLNGHAVRSVDPSGLVATVAGSFMGDGAIDGSTTFARFEYPHDIAVAPNGDVFVADMVNCAVRRISGGQVSTFAGQLDVCGFTDGPANTARFDSVRGLAFASNGDLLVSDTTAIRRVTPAGVVSTVAGVVDNSVSGSQVDGSGTAARFEYVTNIATLGDTIYVIDAWSHLRKIVGSQVSTPFVANTYGLPSVSAMVAHDGKLYAASHDGEVGTLSFDKDGFVRFVPMIPKTGRLTVSLGAGSQVNAIHGMAFTADGKLMLFTEGAVLVSE